MYKYIRQLQYSRCTKVLAVCSACLSLSLPSHNYIHLVLCLLVAFSCTAVLICNTAQQLLWFFFINVTDKCERLVCKMFLRSLEICAAIHLFRDDHPHCSWKGDEAETAAY